MCVSEAICTDHSSFICQASPGVPGSSSLFFWWRHVSCDHSADLTLLSSGSTPPYCKCSFWDEAPLFWRISWAGLSLSVSWTAPSPGNGRSWSPWRPGSAPSAWTCPMTFRWTLGWCCSSHRWGSCSGTLARPCSPRLVRYWLRTLRRAGSCLRRIISGIRLWPSAIFTAGPCHLTATTTVIITVQAALGGNVRDAALWISAGVFPEWKPGWRIWGFLRCCLRPSRGRKVLSASWAWSPSFRCFS